MFRESSCSEAGDDCSLSTSSTAAHKFAYTSMITCPVCDARMRRLRHEWCFHCPGCGFLASNLRPHIGDGLDAGVVDEKQREHALVTLRRKNFERVLDRIDSLVKPSRRSLLEVGCAHGWFLDAAARRGYDVQGIEPEIG